MTPIEGTIPPMPPRMSPLQFLLLIQLETSPKYGYEMLKSIKEAFEGVWELKTGTLYPALKSLERRGLVKTHVQDGVDFYNITDDGRRFLYQIGLHQESTMKFSARFMTTLTKWMSPDLKRNVLNSIVSLTNEDMNLVGGVISLINDGVDKKTKLLFLKGIRFNLSKRLRDIDEMIEKLEVEKD